MGFDAFSKLSTLEQVMILFTTILVVGVIIFSLRWLVLKIIEFFGASIVNGEVVLKTKEGNITAVPSSHSTCPLFKDFLSILQLQQLTLTKIFHIIDQEILRAQMAYAENKIDMSLSVEEKAFCKLLEQWGKKDYLYSAEYVSYKALLEFKREKVLTKFRHMCKDNHFVEKQEDDFAEYVRNNTTIVIDMLIRQSKDFFPFWSSIPGYAASLIPIHEKMTSDISDVLYNARDVVIKANLQIDDLKRVFEDEYTLIVGAKPKWVSL